MQVLVTGGTGFIGAWSAKALQQAGHRVRFFVRNPGRLATSAAALGVDTSDYAIGDITDRGSVASAMVGCDAVLHAAAVVSTDPRLAAQTLDTNLQGARNVLGLAAVRGLDPIVHVSSVAALFRPGLEVIRPDLPLVEGTDAYGRSKSQVDAYARELQSEGRPVCITYPGMVLGPPAGDQFGEAATGVRAALAIGAIPGRGAAWSVVDVRDVAALHAALLKPGRGPRRYTCGGRWLRVTDLAAVLSDASGRRLRVLPVPDTALRLLGEAADIVGRVVPINTPVTAAAMRYYTQMPRVDDSASERDLGIGYRDVAETLSATVDALRASAGTH
ncbi:NAD-dependent epimerase/dehydratase family protein [Skermania sp. ID1734]|uniref:NAD-dependent epimerase/dehydratase family protein n=1 Tax=Skermania sp. ID1734 TaxID=2597516 RepID=UPI0011803502|nr:NAD-dependent epimerase/dehydratase family protein [Skermania sp. ID1734]TSD95073.1 NAD-dependent epimerase/dehydratase family protein [Skermania sp. ID1734]